MAATLRTKMQFPALLPITLVSAGVILLAIAVFSHPLPGEYPYQTRISEARPSTFQAGDGGPEVGKVEELDIHTAGLSTPIAQGLIAREADGRIVPLTWQNNVTEPVLGADTTQAEIVKVTTAVREHVSADAVVLSWWDLSRKIRLLTQRQAPLDDPQARGLLVPEAWADVAGTVREHERAFWGKGVPQQTGAMFSRFIDALLMDEHKGAAALVALAPGKTVYVAVHLSDIWKIAAERPDEISIGYKDFPGSATHGLMKAARDWMTVQKLEGPFAVEPTGNAIRIHYLPKASEANLLITKLLPFTTSNPLLLTSFALVYQHRGFWIYKVTPGQS